MCLWVCLCARAPVCLSVCVCVYLLRPITGTSVRTCACLSVQVRVCMYGYPLRTCVCVRACVHRRLSPPTHCGGVLRSPPDLLSGVDNPVNADYIEELIFRQEPFLRVLRLLCLLSLTTGGLKPKVLESFRREIIQVRRALCLLVCV
jgi:hypothetical protein